MAKIEIGTININAENVSDNVSAIVSQAESTSRGQTALRVRHLIYVRNMWIYQRRIPRLTRVHKHNVVLKKQLGSASLETARKWAARIDTLVDGLFDIAEMHMAEPIDFNSIASDLGEDVLQFMLSRMDAAFRTGTQKIVENGFRDPANSSRGIVETLEFFRSEISQFDSTNLAATPAGNTMRNQLTAKAAEFVGAQDILSNDAELNWRGVLGRDIYGLRESINKTETGQTVLDAGMQAFYQAMQESEDFKEFRRAFVEQKAQRPASSATADKSESSNSASSQNSHKTQINQSLNTTEINAETSALVPTSNTDKHDLMFLGRVDRKYVQREPSQFMRFSDALNSYIETREIRAGLPKGATLPFGQRPPTIAQHQKISVQKTRDILTVRTRAAIFLDIVGDHPLDRYTGEDFEFYAHCLRFLPVNATKQKQNKSGTIRVLLAANEDFDTGQPIELAMARQTVKNGYIGGLRPIFTTNPLPDRKIDPVDLAKIDYKTMFTAQKSREHFGDAEMREIILGGIKRKSLIYTMLPILGFLTARRISALVGLKGKDITIAYSAYETNEKPLFAAKTNDWINANGELVQPSLKTEESHMHFVLHDFLFDIGFTEWAMALGEGHIFKVFQQFNDHESQASKIMNHYFKELGARDGQVFHSLRHAAIAHYRAHLQDENATRHQSAHAQIDEHAKYGSSVLPEITARKIAGTVCPRWLIDLREQLIEVDFSEFRSCDDKGAWR